MVREFVYCPHFFKPDPEDFKLQLFKGQVQQVSRLLLSHWRLYPYLKNLPGPQKALVLRHLRKSWGRLSKSNKELRRPFPLASNCVLNVAHKMLRLHLLRDWAKQDRHERRQASRLARGGGGIHTNTR